jgi:hypothetical protein
MLLATKHTPLLRKVDLGGALMFKLIWSAVRETVRNLQHQQEREYPHSMEGEYPHSMEGEYPHSMLGVLRLCLWMTVSRCG